MQEAKVAESADTCYRRYNIAYRDETWWSNHEDAMAAAGRASVLADTLTKR